MIVWLTIQIFQILFAITITGEASIFLQLLAFIELFLEICGLLFYLIITFKIISLNREIKKLDANSKGKK